MPHNVSPLAIVDHRFLAFECHATDGPEKDGALSLKTQHDLAVDSDDPLRWRVTLTVEFSPEDPNKPSTYAGMMKITGQFLINDSFAEKHREPLIRVTAVSILYGACREQVASFTARSTNGILSLPSISFRKSKSLEPDEDPSPNN